MCKLFFDIDELPDYINYEYSNKINIKKIQNMLNENVSILDISNELNINIHRIYDAIHSNKLYYPKGYNKRNFTKVVKLNDDNVIIDEFASIKDASIDAECSASNLSKILSTGKHKYKNYYWYYKYDVSTH